MSERDVRNVLLALGARVCVRHKSGFMSGSEAAWTSALTNEYDPSELEKLIQWYQEQLQKQKASDLLLAITETNKPIKPRIPSYI
eukprot:1003440-Pyramimonas_sp.AAC.1